MLPDVPTGDGRTFGSDGFTLIELLVVVVIVGILAAIAIPQFNSTKKEAYRAAMKKDLRNVATYQELYFADQNLYASSLADLNAQSEVSTSDGVTVTIREGTVEGWSATADHPRLAGSDDCGFLSGSASDPTVHISGPVTGSAPSDAPYCQE